MKIYFFIIIITIISFNGNCQVNAPINCQKLQKKLEEKGAIKLNDTRCIILCDFSSSMDSISVESVKQEASKIFDVFFGVTTIEFFSITNASRKPFFESPAFMVADSGRITKPQFNQFRNCIAEDEKNQKKAFIRILDQECKNRQKATYLIHSIERAIDEILLNDLLQQHRNIVYVLSDMRESASSSLGKFDLDRPNFKSVFAILSKASNRADLPELSKNIEFRIGFFSSDASPYSDLKKFWNIVFAKLHNSKQIKFTRSPSIQTSW